MDAETYIQELAEGAGAAGEWTLDPVRALKLTARFGECGTDGWILRGIQATVAAGATAVQLNAEGQGVDAEL